MKEFKGSYRAKLPGDWQILTYDTLTLVSSEMPERSAASVNALTIPISVKMFLGGTSVEMENFGRKMSTDLKYRDKQKG